MWMVRFDTSREHSFTLSPSKVFKFQTWIAGVKGRGRQGLNGRATLALQMWSFFQSWHCCLTTQFVLNVGICTLKCAHSFLSSLLLCVTKWHYTRQHTFIDKSSHTHTRTHDIHMTVATYTAHWLPNWVMVGHPYRRRWWTEMANPWPRIRGHMLLPCFAMLLHLHMRNIRNVQIW